MTVRKAAVGLALLGLATSACSATGNTGSLPPADPTTIETLDAAVTPAAQAILDGAAVEVTITWFDGDGAHVRTDWLDWRSDGNYRMYSQSVRHGDTAIDQMAWVQLDGDRYCATAGPNMYCDVEDPKVNEPWAQRNSVSAGLAATKIPISADLENMASNGSSSEGVPGNAGTASRQAGADGTTAWSVDSPFGEGSLNRTWTIGADGSLASYSTGSESETPFGLYSRTDFKFAVIDDPAPITVPALDTPLDLGILDLPADLPQFDR